MDINTNTSRSHGQYACLVDNVSYDWFDDIPLNNSELGLYTPAGYHTINKTWARDCFESLCRYANPTSTNMWDILWSPKIASKGNYTTLVNGGDTCALQISSDSANDSMFGFRVSGYDIRRFVMLSLLPSMNLDGRAIAVANLKCSTHSSAPGNYAHLTPVTWRVSPIIRGTEVYTPQMPAAMSSLRR